MNASPEILSDFANIWTLNGLCTLLISVLVTGILIPRILLISYRKNLFDIPDERKIHRGAVPRLGGMAFMPSIVLSTAIVTGVGCLMNRASLPGGDISPITYSPAELCFGASSLMVMYLVGLADDLVGVKYRAKLVAQAIAAVMVMASGLMVTSLQGFLGIEGLPAWASWTLTLLVILLVMNAINFIDGIDGLASGLCAVALTFYAIVCYAEGAYVYFMLALATLGTLIPFFYYNVFGSQKLQKKIFMGDTGALTSGLILCVIALKISNMPTPANWFSDCKPLVLAFAPLVVPCLDVLRVFFHRLRNHKSPFAPGRTHIHHKFLALGIKQRYAMLIIVCLSAAIVLLDFAMSQFASIFAILMTDIAIWTILNIILTYFIRRREKLHPEARGFFN